MSISSRSDSDVSFFDAEELLHIEERCRELRREKDLLKETQSQSFDLIKKLELHVRRLNEARLEDKKQIQELQRELNNCHQEIDYLRDQLNEKNAYTDSLEEDVSNLNEKLSDFDLLEEEIVSLRDELHKSNSEREFLTQELETKETELLKSCLHIEKLEESISSTVLEYQCEIESLRLEMMSLEPKKSESEYNEEKDGLNKSVLELGLKLDDAQNNIKYLEHENQKATERLLSFENEAKLFRQRVEEHFRGRLEDGNERKGLLATSEVDSCGVILGPLLSKLLTIGTLTETNPDQLLEYERLVKKLKDELKEQKYRAKEEAEDLAQEMAELRYQMTELLEEERKRRSCIEQASLHRISELETQLQMEQRKYVAISRGICEA
ncbi:hypothetical protein RND81_13G113500 [Saponaria officinalis]|uniref:Uncharacterized protein n=1 Tax=Saponaria officinalis TaxID=3572 RepID=A0AAW1GYM2_SAPOF